MYMFQIPIASLDWVEAMEKAVAAFMLKIKIEVIHVRKNEMRLAFIGSKKDLNSFRAIMITSGFSYKDVDYYLFGEKV